MSKPVGGMSEKDKEPAHDGDKDPDAVEDDEASTHSELVVDFFECGVAVGGDYVSHRGFGENWVIKHEGRQG